MKAVLKQVVERTARNRFCWSVYKGCGWLSEQLRRVYGHAEFVRQTRNRDERLTSVVKELFPALTVANGPFKGMRYPAPDSFGSMLLPKLLGSYESELHPFFQEIFANRYTTIVDIGCAEGYYATGLALRFTSAEVYAFDTAAKAREMCAEMAELNGVRDRIHIGGFCDEATLRSIPLGDKALIISDCEGYENVLFNKGIAEHLRNQNLIIEAHDFIDIETSLNLRRIFSATHHVETVRSLDDIEKAHAYQYPELKNYSTSEKREILGERRPGTMRWFLMTALNPL
jgi:precorrin-6B methylase 2